MKVFRPSSTRALVIRAARSWCSLAGLVFSCASVAACSSHSGSTRGSSGSATGESGGTAAAAGGHGSGGAASGSGGSDGGPGGASPDGSVLDPLHPAWLVGAYLYPTPTDHSAEQTSEAMFIRFEQDGTYVRGAGSTTDAPAEWQLTGTVLSFSGGGPLSGQTFDLTTYMSPNCRILYVEKALRRDELVPDCPFHYPPLTADECALVGRYTRSESTGTPDNGIDSTYRVRLDGDRYYEKGYDTTSNTCYGTSCTSLFTSPVPDVGSWKLEGGSVILDDGQQIPWSPGGYDFQPGQCAPGASGTGGAPSGTGGTTGGSGGAAGSTGGTAGGSGGGCTDTPGTPGSCVNTDPTNPCGACIEQSCCSEWQACTATAPDSACSAGAPDGSGEIFCFQNCLMAAGTSDSATQSSCRASCATGSCGDVTPTTAGVIDCWNANCAAYCMP